MTNKIDRRFLSYQASIEIIGVAKATSLTLENTKSPSKLKSFSITLFLVMENDLSCFTLLSLTLENTKECLKMLILWIHLLMLLSFETLFKEDEDNLTMASQLLSPVTIHSPVPSKFLHLIKACGLQLKETHSFSPIVKF